MDGGREDIRIFIAPASSLQAWGWLKCPIEGGSSPRQLFPSSSPDSGECFLPWSLALDFYGLSLAFSCWKLDCQCSGIERQDLTGDV